MLKKVNILSQNRPKGIKKEHFINSDIPFNKMYVIDENKEQLGVLEKSKALELASDKNLDLVIISVNPKPIARIMDYGKFKYNRNKKQKEEKAKQTRVENHEVRLTPLIGINDLKIKARKAREFILKGDVVKVAIRFKGREIQKKNLGLETLENFRMELDDIAVVNGDINDKLGKIIYMTLTQDKKKMEKYLNNLKKQDTNIKETQEEINNAKNED
ncbi:MAG: translation initiation factor IF-3 [Metamycoplasmataceae bacterium]